MSQPVRILLGLAVGLLLGLATAGASWSEGAAAVAEPIGGLWLDALRMTIVPLVVSLLITGIAQTAEAARANKLAARAIIFFLAFLWFSAASAALLTPLLLSIWPLDSGAAAALRGALSSTTEVGEVPGFAEFIRWPLRPTTPFCRSSSSRCCSPSPSRACRPSPARC